MKNSIKKVMRRPWENLALLAVAAVCYAAPQATMANPMVQISIQARLSGTADPFGSSVLAVPGGVYDYIVIAGLAPIGTPSSNGAGSTIASLAYNSHVTTGDGINNLKFDLYQSSDDLVPLDMFAPGTLNNAPVSPTVAADIVSWAAGTGAKGGTPTTRLGQLAHDLFSVRPVHITGVQTAVSSEVLLSGQFSLNSLLPNNPSSGSYLRGRWTNGGTGVFKINGGTGIAVSTTTESGPDPYVAFSNLAIVPEPTLLSLFFLGGAFLLRRSRHFVPCQ